MKHITLDEAKTLKVGTILYHIYNVNADFTAQRWRVTGKPKTWKRSPERVQVPVKHGLYDYGYLTEKSLTCVSLVDPAKQEQVEECRSINPATGTNEGC